MRRGRHLSPRTDGRERGSRDSWKPRFQLDTPVSFTNEGYVPLFPEGKDTRFDPRVSRRRPSSDPAPRVKTSTKSTPVGDQVDRTTGRDEDRCRCLRTVVLPRSQTGGREVRREETGSFGGNDFLGRRGSPSGRTWWTSSSMVLGGGGPITPDLSL